MPFNSIVVCLLCYSYVYFFADNRFYLKISFLSFFIYDLRCLNNVEIGYFSSFSLFNLFLKKLSLIISNLVSV